LAQHLNGTFHALWGRWRRAYLLGGLESQTGDAGVNLIVVQNILKFLGPIFRVSEKNQRKGMIATLRLTGS
jgi:hypothetical protein